MTIVIVSFIENVCVLFQPRSKGVELYKKVNNDLNLDEPEFFGLLFQDEHENNVSFTNGSEILTIRF